MVRALIVIVLFVAHSLPAIAQADADDALMRTLHETRVDASYVAMDFD